MTTLVAATEIGIESLRDAGFIAFLFFVGFAGFKGWWVYGPEARRQMTAKDDQIAEIKASEKEWKDLAVQLLRTTERATTAAESIIKDSKSPEGG